MRIKLFWILLIIGTPVIMTACQQNITTSPGDSSPKQTDPPIDQPYPGPEVNVQPEDNVFQNPYPEPQTRDETSVIPNEHEFSPAPGDDKLTRGNVMIETSDVLVLESDPIQVKLFLEGNLPTPCNKLRVITSPPDKENKIQVGVYSLRDPDVMCMQVLEPFSTKIPLGNFPEGEFTIWINGEELGKFQIP